MKANLQRASIFVRMIEEPQGTLVSLEPLDDYVVIEPSDEEAETRHGLIIPASAEAGCRTGIVTAVGTESGGIEPGDKVLFPKDAGFDVRLAGSAGKVIRRGELIARVHD
jgi:co-chaperonin GroES (HSP10)